MEEMAVKLNVTDREGALREVEGEEGDTLMRLLRDQGFGTEGTCGGECSCGTCHIYLGDALLALLEKPSEEEADMLDALSDVIEVRPSSRLACQINLAPAMEGVSLEVAPQL